ncbi:Alpha/beta hydrolase family protein [Thiorhodovibrio winogradskyi]|uniref:Alpha/beta hydrolase family protein n=1 Tax=Thiorhodovibrio winogradskyi TaxID=77007 RepID=A0ABZ0S8N6_9GAMM
MLAALLTGCTGSFEKSDILANHRDLTAGAIIAKGYQLRTYRHGQATPGQSLHVYLEGDGRPWLSRTRISPDPSPKRQLALELMALDPLPSLYLGRPCYFGQAQAPGCSPHLWTFARYSETVVATMAAALRQIMTEEHIEQLTLIGYSGGGVIAWLLAERLPEVTRLITIAANLNVEAWTRHHGYSPLTDSLDPSTRAPLRATVAHWHLIGTKDTQVPAYLSDNQIGPELQNARISRLNIDHNCCWTNRWPDILQCIQRAPSQQRMATRHPSDARQIRSNQQARHGQRGALSLPSCPDNRRHGGLCARASRWWLPRNPWISF